MNILDFSKEISEIIDNISAKSSENKSEDFLSPENEILCLYIYFLLVLSYLYWEFLKQRYLFLKGSYNNTQIYLLQNLSHCFL